MLHALDSISHIQIILCVRTVSTQDLYLDGSLNGSPRGIRTPTAGSEDRCSSPLSYGTMVWWNAAGSHCARHGDPCSAPVAIPYSGTVQRNCTVTPIPSSAIGSSYTVTNLDAQGGHDPPTFGFRDRRSTYLIYWALI